MTFSWPAALEPETISWAIQKAAVNFRSPMAGSVESIEFPGQFWKVAVTLPPRTMKMSGVASAFFARLAGGSETVFVPYWPRRTPLGTMRGSPTLSANAARGDLTLQISTTGTLLAGDAIGVGNQLFLVFQDCTPVSGVLTVPLVNRVRGAIGSGTAVVWSQPLMKANMPADNFSASYMTNILAGLPIDLEEV